MASHKHLQECRDRFPRHLSLVALLKPGLAGGSSILLLKALSCFTLSLVHFALSRRLAAGTSWAKASLLGMLTDLPHHAQPSLADPPRPSLMLALGLLPGFRGWEALDRSRERSMREPHGHQLPPGRDHHGAESLCPAVYHRSGGPS